MTPCSASSLRPSPKHSKLILSESRSNEDGFAYLEYLFYFLSEFLKADGLTLQSTTNVFVLQLCVFSHFELPNANAD